MVCQFLNPILRTLLYMDGETVFVFLRVTGAQQTSIYYGGRDPTNLRAGGSFKAEGLVSQVLKNVNLQTCG
jgi:hypothetical protein